ncbi:uncharacterized protein hbt [Drosophila pseudoobscura]|uniref:Uncharacterized protein hbt n=1 Tax=Drosophila pseudoobscura pseudoobscura TaxID=46245 RepID=A0A6I8UHY2_DROPS|nr:uncharacterized protein LOC4816199 [Drosophila pseudoobscura]
MSEVRVRPKHRLVAGSVHRNAFTLDYAQFYLRPVPISGQQQQQTQQQHQQIVQQQLLAQQQHQLQIQQLQQQLLLQQIERELQQHQQLLYSQRQAQCSYPPVRQRWLSGSHYDYAAPQQLVPQLQQTHPHQQQQHLQHLQQQQEQQQQQQYSYYFSRGSTSTSSGLGLGLGLGFGLGSGNLASWYHLPSTSAHIYIGTTSSGGAGTTPYPYPYRGLGAYSGGGYPAAALINFDASPTPLLASAGTSPGYLPPLPVPAVLPPPPPAPSVATDYYFSSRSTRTLPPQPTAATAIGATTGTAAAAASAARLSPFQEYTANAAEELQAGYRYKATPRRRYDAYDNYGYLPGFASTTEDEEDLLDECLPAALLSTDCDSLEEVRFLQHQAEEDDDEDDEEVATQLAHILDLPDFLHPYGGGAGGSSRGSIHSHKTPPQHEYQTEHGSAAAGGGGGATTGGGGGVGGTEGGGSISGGGVGQSQRETVEQRYHQYQYQQQHHHQQQQFHHHHHQQQQQQQQQQQFQQTPQQSQGHQQQAYHSYQYPSQDSCEGFNHFANDTSSCLGNQRMMVSKLWNSCFPEFTPDHVHRHNFYLCQWQRNTQVRIVYLFYRWITAITCLAALVCSLLDIGRTEEHFEHHYAKWWIYLTHWGLLFCTVQAWLAAWIVTQGMMVEREDFEIVRQAKKSRLHHLYWVLYTCATVYAFIVTMCYWLLVHNSEIHKIDTLNIMVHVLNSIIMLIDLAIVGHPIKMSHAYFTTGIGLAYAIFTGIYFLAGGTDRKNQTAIYPMMDWTKPGKAIIVTACAIIFTFFVHFCCYLLYRGRVWLFTKLCIRGRHNRDGEMGEGLNDDSGSRMGGGGGGGTVGGTGGGFSGSVAAATSVCVGAGGSSQDYAHQQQYPIPHTEQPRAGNQQQHQQQQPPANYQAPPQYSGYLQQPVVAGVNVGVISAEGVYQPIGTDSGRTSGGGGGGVGVAVADGSGKHKSASGSGSGSGSGSALTRTVAHLDASQREQFLNPNKIVEYKM